MYLVANVKVIFIKQIFSTDINYFKLKFSKFLSLLINHFLQDETYSVQAVLIYGSPDNCSLACQKILEVMQQESNNTNRG